MQDLFVAHIRGNEGGIISKQTVSEHCLSTARIAGALLDPIHLGKAAYLAASLHDMGKYKQEFQTYLMRSFTGESVVKGSVIHTFAGVRYLLEQFHSKDNLDETGIAAEILAYAVGAHHGLFDIASDHKENGFLYRLRKNNIAYEESRDNYLKYCQSEATVKNLMNSATNELWSVIYGTILTMSNQQNEGNQNVEIAFYMGALERLILSAVIEGDRSDTAAFMLGTAPKQIGTINWSKYLSIVENKLEELPKHKAIDRARNVISNQCRAAAENNGETALLNVPTGAGKTLASLRYALAHATKYGKRHIIFTVPLLSILEQNANVIRSYIEDDSIILEHHSNVLFENDSEDNGEHESLIESWNAPIIITTLVQLLNTMFSGRTACIRRFHALADSIIVIDEVQTVPTKLLSMFSLMINFLTAVCKSTVVLCSATQPELTITSHPLAKKPLDIVPYNKDIWNTFKRTMIQNGGSCALEDVPEFAERIIGSSRNLLIVCNKKDEAAYIFYKLRSNGHICFHLSASMCMEHRREVLREITQRIKDKGAGKPLICVATQVIEAGVDISFETVIRFEAGMDSVIQAAGRCNRNAERVELSNVYILRIKGENLKRLPDIKRGKDATESLLYDFSCNRKKFADDLSSIETIREYYKKYYSMFNVGDMDYPIVDPNCTLLDLLSDNQKYKGENSDRFYYCQAFKTAGRLFQVFEEDSIDAIVPFGEGKTIINELCSIDPSDYIRKRTLIKKAAQYSITVYRYQQKELEKTGGLYWICDNTVAVLCEQHYEAETGFTMSPKELDYLEV